MNLRVNQPHRNGTYEAPHNIRGVSSTSSPARPQATTFPNDARLRGLHPVLYALSRFQLSGMPVLRLLAGALLFLTVLSALDALPGGRWGAAVWLLLLGVLFWSAHSARRTDFVAFQETAWPKVSPQRLRPDDKLSVHATGQFSVEGKYRRLTWLPGFYRTFATNEHALLCLARERHWLLLASWPNDEPGMWYAFIAPSEITRIRWGNLRFGRNHGPGVAIDYRLTIPAEGGRKRDQIRAETLYLAFASRQEAEIALADLAADHPQGRPAGDPEPP